MTRTMGLRARRNRAFLSYRDTISTAGTVRINLGCLGEISICCISANRLATASTSVIIRLAEQHHEAMLDAEEEEERQQLQADFATMEEAL